MDDPLQREQSTIINMSSVAPHLPAYIMQNTCFVVCKQLTPWSPSGRSSTASASWSWSGASWRLSVGRRSGRGGWNNHIWIFYENPTHAHGGPSSNTIQLWIQCVHLKELSRMEEGMTWKHHYSLTIFYVDETHLMFKGSSQKKIRSNLGHSPNRVGH